MRITRVNSMLLSGLLAIAALGSTLPAQAQGARPAAKQQAESFYRGVVVDDENEPLPGVTVRVKGSKTVGTVTDANGEFYLVYRQPQTILTFTYVGMKTQEVRAQSNKRINVRLEPSAEALKEVVANGIYTRNIESFTGSVSTFDNTQLKMISGTNLLKSLSALDASIIMPDNNLMGSDPNTLPDLTINGKMNVQALTQEYETDPNQPLFILDGFESSLKEISDLNMDRVDKISILKDASATAIYGSKAANGVIVVETKRPEAGRLQVSYNGSLQVAWADLGDYNLMNAAQKLEYELRSGEYGEYGPDMLPVSEGQRNQYFERLRLVKGGNDNYWLNEPLRTAITQTHNLYVQGGDQSFRYGAGISYNKTEGVMKGSDRNVFNHNVSLTYRVDNFNFTNQTTINYTSNQNELVAFSRFAEMNPFYDKRASNGEAPKYVYKEEGGATVWNPLWDMEQNSFRKGNVTSITDNFQMEWRILRQLRLRGNFQYQVQKSTNENFTSPDETSQAQLDPDKRGSYYNQNSTSTNYTGRLNLSYGLVFGVNTVNAVGGMQFAEKNNQSYSFMAQGYSNDLFWNPNFSKGYPQNGKPSSKDTKSRNVSYYANLNYAYDMRYLFDANLSYSGASQFGIDNPFTGTWSVGLGWNVHNEAFLKDNRWLNYLKLKASYGNPGNQNYDAKLAASIYQYLNTYTNPFGLANIVEQWGNRGLKWQKTKTYNVGVTATLFNNRLSLNADYQIRKTDPQLVRIDMPASTGVTSAPMNVGGTDNRSITASATFYIIKKTDLNWYISGNINHYTTKYFGIGNALDEYNKAGKEDAAEANASKLKNNTSSALTRMYDGASTSALYAVRSLGIDPATGCEVYLDRWGNPTYEWTSDNEVIVGDSNPDFTGNLSTSFIWKGFSVAASFSVRSGAEVPLTTLIDKVENISKERVKYNQDARALTDRWKNPGDVAKYKRIDDTSTTRLSTRFIKTEHTLQCTSVNVGYRTTDARFLRAVGAKSLDFRVYMNDIFRISNIKEERGLSYPFQRSFTASLGFSF